jgi:hypothetical protein
MNIWCTSPESGAIARAPRASIYVNKSGPVIYGFSCRYARVGGPPIDHVTVPGLSKILTSFSPFAEVSPSLKDRFKSFGTVLDVEDIGLDGLGES